MKKNLLPVLLLCAALLLSGCSAPGMTVTPDVSEKALPAASVDYTAPVGDAALTYSTELLLYYPSYDGMRLTAIPTEVACKLSCPAAESVVRAMLAFRGSGSAESLGGKVRLSLLGSSPVEVSRDTVTVNLGAAALRLERSRLYMVGQALANTLCQLDGIRYVNLLVSGNPVGLDVANTLPMGAFTATDARDIAAAYEQQCSRRVSAEESASKKPFTANVTLYYPLSGMDGTVCATRSLSFESQLLQDVVDRILNELARGLESEGVSSPQLPLLADLLTALPRIVPAEGNGGSLLELCFAQNLEDMLDAYGVSREAGMASLARTFSTFLPGVRGVSVEVSGAPVDSLLMVEEDASSPETRGETFLREDGAVTLCDYCTLFFANAEGGLTEVSRPVEYYRARTPRTLLQQLARGPQPEDGAEDLLPVMPEDLLTDTVLIGLSLDGPVVLVNLSPAFVLEEDAMSAEGERLLAYAMTGTLCAGSPADAVCFFRSGKQFGGFGGEVSWEGLFYPLPAEKPEK